MMKFCNVKIINLTLDLRSTVVFRGIKSSMMLASRNASRIKAVVIGICFSVVGLMTLDRLLNLSTGFLCNFNLYLELLAYFFGPLGLITQVKK